MQDIHSIGGGSRLFNAGGGDRRLRPQNQLNHQALKCPRCESLNTKFCYYNNYNLSQPRHFCKACRRYWTKGGVLRNVPVGGGCRKTKRSKPKQTASTTDNATTTATATTAVTTATTATTTATLSTRPPPEQQTQEQQGERKSSNSHSSSESSSLTAANTAATGNTALEVVSAHSSSSASNNLLNSMNESKLFGHTNLNSNFQVEQGSDCGIFSEIGSFTSLINSTNDHLGFGFSNMMDPHGLEQVQQDQNQQWQQPPEKMTGGFIDQTVHDELSALQSSRSGNGGGDFGPLDWQGTGDQGLFDLPNAVDQNYWNQSQWTDQDQPSLYLP